MSNYNSEYNNVVWVDIPVSDLDRSIAFYSAVLGSSVSKEEMEGLTFGVFMHEQGNGGCLVIKEGEISSSHGILVYMNVNGRIQDAVGKVEEYGGSIVNEIHGIGPHGFRAIVIDSEGNRLALHSDSDE